MNTNSNTNNYTTEAKAFIADVHEHSDFEERSVNKKTCIASELLEQERRVEDQDGELLRRMNAKLTSSFILNAHKTTSTVPDFAAVVKEAMINAGSNISAAASNAKTNTEEFGSRGWSLVRTKASEASSKIQDVNISGPVIDVRMALVNTAIHATQLVVDVSHKGAEITEEVSRKGAELSQIGEDKFHQTTKKISDSSIIVADSFQRFIKFGDYAFELVSDVLKRIAKQFSGWISNTWSQAIYNANLSYNVHLAEKEKRRRMTSEDESSAVLNALAVSSLIKELGPEFYRPTEEPSRAYTFALLEQKEQRSRIVQERLGGNLSGKARFVANLIKTRGQEKDEPSAELKELLPVFSAEQVIYPDPMQIFEEPRNIAEELAPVKTIEKLHESGTSSTDSPTALRLAM